MNIKTMGCYTKLPTSHLAGKTVIMVDVLRSSTSMTWALMNGANKVIPADEPAEAVRIASRLGDCVLAGERGGLKIPGFDIGNSPAEFSSSVVRGKNIVISTTNGTGALCGAEGAACVLVGSLINCTAVAKRAAELGNDIVIMCAGTDGELSADDIYAAGAISEAVIRAMKGGVKACDLTLIACMVYENWKNDQRDLALTRHYAKLMGMGLEADIKLCLSLDLTDVVPVYRDGVLELA